jgi:hypothetical protein
VRSAPAKKKLWTAAHQFTMALDLAIFMTMLVPYAQEAIAG